MTNSEIVRPREEHQATSLGDIDTFLDHVRSMDNPSEQLMHISLVHPGAGESLYVFNLDGPDIDKLIDFAVDRSSSRSLFVRLQALDSALAGMRFSSARHRSDDDAAIDFLGYSDPFIDAREKLIENPCYPTGYLNSSTEASAYRMAIFALAEKEGISKEAIWAGQHPDAVSGADPLNFPDAVPARALTLIDRLYDYRNRPEDLPVNRLSKLIPVAIEFYDFARNELFACGLDISDRSSSEILHDAKEISGFLNHIIGDERLYVDQLTDLKDAAKKLKDIFPSRLAEGVELGANKLFSECLYAIRAHLENDKHTDVKIPLNGKSGKKIKIAFKGDEPLEIVGMLTQAIETLVETVRSNTATVEAVNTSFNGFSEYLLHPDDELGSNVSVYIRPEASLEFDQFKEYGKQGAGVEASIKFIIDPHITKDETIALGRSIDLSSDSRICFRLDREGEKIVAENGKYLSDPLSEQGRVSLDVGAIFGNADWAGTKIGRLLAYGNYLRSVRLGQDPTLNHAKSHFSHDDGLASNFAESARQLQSYIESLPTYTGASVQKIGNIAIR